MDKVITHNIKQGTPEWLELRSAYGTASELPAVMGASPYKSYNDFVAEKATGETPETSEFLKKLFQKGHDAEAGARPIAEKMLQAELFPVTVTRGNMLASLDGLTMDNRTIFEHKLWNQNLADCIDSGAGLPEHIRWQLDQQLLVSGAERVFFVTSDGTRENWRDTWYFLTADRAEAIATAWERFAKDVAAYQVPKAEVVAKPLAKLPTLLVEISGEVKETNIVAYNTAVTARIEAINTDLKTDQDFADAEVAAKFLQESEAELLAVKKRAIAQTQTIEQLFDAIDSIAEASKAKRLALTKLIKARKTEIKIEIISKAKKEFSEIRAELERELNGYSLPDIPLDVLGAMKNKRTLSSLKDAARAEVLRVEIEATEAAKRMRINLATYKREKAGRGNLFPDLQVLLWRPTEDFANAVLVRVAAALETERKIKAEAEAKASDQAAAALETERKIKAEAEAKASDQAAAALETERKIKAEAEASDQSASDVNKVNLTDNVNWVKTQGARGARATIVQLVANDFELTLKESEALIIKLFQ